MMCQESSGHGSNFGHYPDIIAHQKAEAERKKDSKKNSLTATLFCIYKSKQLLPVNDYQKI
jgi:hypothetical protein